MPYFLLNIMLAVLWMCMWGLFDIWSLIAGLLIGYFLLGVISRTLEPGKGYGTKGWHLLSFSMYFLRILIKANLQVASEIITPGLKMTPRFVRYPVAGMTDLQITSLANAITLTPGTLTVDVINDQSELLVHCMYAKDRNAAIAELDELKNRMLKEVFS